MEQVQIQLWSADLLLQLLVAFLMVKKPGTIHYITSS
jgi:hypothetical protein